MNEKTKLTLNLDDVNVLDDFMTMTFISKQILSCHIEDRACYEGMFEIVKDKVLSHYIKICDDFDKNSFESVIINTYDKLWGSDDLFDEIYQQWIINFHTIPESFWG